MKCEKCNGTSITIRKTTFENKKGCHVFWYCDDCKNYAEKKLRWLSQKNIKFISWIKKNQNGIIKEKGEI